MTKAKQTLYFFEMTDTFGGEANYCWVNRFIVSASSFSGAIRKVAKETGCSNRVHCVMDSGDFKRWDVSKAAICFFGEWYDEQNHSQYMNVTKL